MWILPETLELIENNYKRDNCRSKSGYINANRETSYLPNVMLSNMKAIVDQETDQQNKLIFKLCVELAMIESILVVTNDLRKDDIEKLRGDCIDIIKRVNGNFKFESVAKWQNG